MRDWKAIQNRFQRDSVQIRLGGLATNLARINTFSKRSANKEIVFGVLEESKFFIEWTAAEADISVAAKIVEIQVQLALWQLDWDEIWDDSIRLESIARQAMKWSDEIMEDSGLLQDQSSHLERR